MLLLVVLFVGRAELFSLALVRQVGGHVQLEINLIIQSGQFGGLKVGVLVEERLIVDARARLHMFVRL